MPFLLEATIQHHYFLGFPILKPNAIPKYGWKALWEMTGVNPNLKVKLCLWTGNNRYAIVIVSPGGWILKLLSNSPYK